MVDERELIRRARRGDQQAFELLTSSLLLDGKEGGGIHTVCILGAQEGYGASTTALNLALTVATTGRALLDEGENDYTGWVKTTAASRATTPKLPDSDQGVVRAIGVNTK